MVNLAFLNPLIKILLVGLALVFAVSLHAQKRSSIDSLYIEDYSDQLSLALYSKVKYADFELRDEVNDESLKYSPNRQINLGLYYHYQKFGLGLAFGIGFLNTDDDVKGNTSRIDLQGNIYGRKFIFDLSLMNYRSYYLRNSKHIITGWEKGDPSYIRPDIRMFNMGGAATYIFNNKKFSYRAAFLQTDIQKKSAGSMLGGLVFNVNSLRSDSSFFPTQSVFHSFPNVNMFNSLSFGFKLGYAYNLIIKEQYFLSLALSPSMLLAFEHAMKNDAHNARLNLTLAIQPRMSIGYNSKVWYYGFAIVEDIYTLGRDFVKDGVAFRYTYGNVKFFVGRRFPSFQWSKVKDTLF